MKQQHSSQTKCWYDSLITESKTALWDDSAQARLSLYLKEFLKSYCYNSLVIMILVRIHCTHQDHFKFW